MSDAFFLKMTHGSNVKEYSLDRPMTAIGRNTDNQIILGDAQVSRHHAQIDFWEGTPRITDLGSTNGTLVNGAKIKPNEPYRIKEGDSVSIGSYTFSVNSLSMAAPIVKEKPAAQVSRQTMVPIKKKKSLRGKVLAGLITGLVLVLAVGAALLFTRDELRHAGEESTPTTTQPQPSEPVATTVPISSTIDVIVDKNTAKLGEEGGKIKLKNGATLVIPAGALKNDVTMELAQLDNPLGCGKGTVVYELTGLPEDSNPMELTFPAEKGLGEEEIALFCYDVETKQAGDIAYVYDSAGGSVTVTIDPKKFTAKPEFNTQTGLARITLSHMCMTIAPHYNPQKNETQAGLFKRLRILVEIEREYIPKTPEILIRLPFYEQTGGGCASADAAMMLTGYEPSENRLHYGNILSNVKASDGDFGLGTFGEGFNVLLPGYIRAPSGATVETRSYASLEHLKWRLLRELESQHPVILELNELGHVVLVVGYQSSGDKFILHDSKGMSPPSETDGGMYTIRSWSWIEKQRGDLFVKTDPFIRGIFDPRKITHVLCINSGAVADSLLSVGCPGGNEKGGSQFGECKFYELNPKNNQRVSLAELQFRPSKPEGVRWQHKMEDVEVIPSEVTALSMKFPLWNAEFSENVVDVEIRFRNIADTLFRWSQESILLPAADFNRTSPVRLEADIPLEEVRDLTRSTQEGTLEVDIDVNLMQGGAIKDTYTLRAVLSVLPLIKELSASQVAPGEQVTIKGSCFGKKESSRSDVILNNESCRIISWKDNEIVIQVPDDAQPGIPLPLIVITGERYEYKSNSVPLTISGGTGGFSLNCQVNDFGVNQDPAIWSPGPEQKFAPAYEWSVSITTMDPVTKKKVTTSQKYQSNSATFTAPADWVGISAQFSVVINETVSKTYAGGASLVSISCGIDSTGKPEEYVAQFYDAREALIYNKHFYANIVTTFSVPGGLKLDRGFYSPQDTKETLIVDCYAK